MASRSHGAVGDDAHVLRRHRTDVAGLALVRGHDLLLGGEAQLDPEHALLDAVEKLKR